MKISAHFYAQLRDVTCTDRLDLDVSEDATVSDLLQLLYAQFSGLGAHDKTILVGVGVEFVDRNYQLKPGEEIAVMPPVQGG